MTSKHPSPLAKKFASPLSLSKIMETVFWDHQGKLLVHFLDRGDKMQRLIITVVPLRAYTKKTEFLRLSVVIVLQYATTAPCMWPDTALQLGIYGPPSLQSRSCV